MVAAWWQENLRGVIEMLVPAPLRQNARPWLL